MVKFVGHRGMPERAPENTLISAEKALLAGADAVEVDIQFSSDGVPYLLHDPSLQRTSDRRGMIAELSEADLASVSVHEPARFGSRYFPTPIPSLAEFCSLLATYPDRTAFIEIKTDALTHLSRENIVSQLQRVLRNVLEQVVLISYDKALLTVARQQLYVPVGWILSQYQHSELTAAKLLRPNYLICNEEKVGEGTLWEGPWQWFLYDTVELVRAQQLHAMGAEWIESWNVAALRRDWSESAPAQ